VPGTVLGGALADGSGLAAMTTATPAIESRPMARAAVAMPRRIPPSSLADDLDGSGIDDTAGSIGSLGSMSVLLVRMLGCQRWQVEASGGALRTV
jgi:hypothetical protein